jgi:sugar phosphate isomerase/epimerase
VKLSYSTHGLPGSLFEILDELENAGYAGVELAFQEGQLDLREIPLVDIAHCPLILKLQAYFKTKKIKPAAINTATLPLEPGRLHEPSVISLNEEGRWVRIHLIQKGIALAKAIGAPIVTFGSGFIRAEHVPHPEIDCEALLLASIRECLTMIADEDEVTLVIEPEPGMLVETLEQGARIVKLIDSSKFGLHLDVCHAFCSDGATTYVQAIREIAPLVKYVHLADTQDGYNLKIIEVSGDEALNLDFDFASYLLHSPKTGDFLFLDGKTSIDFKHKEQLPPIGRDQAGSLASEIKTYLLSMPRIAYETMDRAIPILQYLRTTLNPTTGRPLIDERLANTLTGKVHFHQAPGEGEIDFAAVFQCLEEASFQGYASLELYHDGEPDRWRQVMQRSKVYLDTKMNF